MRNRFLALSIPLLSLVAISGWGFQNDPKSALQQATKADHAQMLEQLHITSLRPGVNARVLGAANYDEAKANPYPDLPDPLTLVATSTRDVAVSTTRRSMAI